MRKIVAKPEVCMGCHLCEVWCAVAHSKSKNIIKAFLYEKPRPLPRVIVEERPPVTFAWQCRHCQEPDCVSACISGALFKDPASGRVIHDSSKCVGCYSCVMACPYGSIIINDESREVLKCDLCAGLNYIYCVNHCPNEALVYLEEQRGR